MEPASLSVLELPLRSELGLRSELELALALVTESVSPLALTSDLAWAWQLVSRLALEVAWAWQLVLTSALESQSVLELESYSELAWQSAPACRVALAVGEPSKGPEE